MPLYEYQCEKCQYRFDRIQGFDDKLVAVCPLCGGKVSRLFHPTPVVFKGDGFYSTDRNKKS